MNKKCEQFKNYLHSSGAINALKEALASVYRMEPWPANPIDFICLSLPIVSLTTEADKSKEEVQHLQNLIPNKEAKKDLQNEIGKNVEDEKRSLDENGLETVRLGPSWSIDEDQEMIRMVEKLSQESSGEEKKTDEIPIQEIEKQSKVSSPGSQSPDEEAKKLSQPLSQEENKTVESPIQEVDKPSKVGSLSPDEKAKKDLQNETAKNVKRSLDESEIEVMGADPNWHFDVDRDVIQMMEMLSQASSQEEKETDKQEDVDKQSEINSPDSQSPEQKVEESEVSQKLKPNQKNRKNRKSRN